MYYVIVCDWLLICLKVLEMYSYFFVFYDTKYEWHYFSTVNDIIDLDSTKDRRNRDHMVVGFITTYAISAYYH